MRRACVIIAVLCVCITVTAAPPEPKPICDATMRYWSNMDGRSDFIEVYANVDQQTDPAEYYISAADAGAAYGDDLQLTAGGELAEFKFVYYDPPGDAALSTVAVNFYANDAGDADFPGGDPGSTLIGSYPVGGLLGDGLHTVTFTVGSPITLPENIWMEVVFTDSPDAGLVLHNPPTIGASDDLFYVNGDSIYVLGYPYVANFGFSVSLVEDEPPPPCPGDFNGDGEVGLSDLAILLANYGTPSGALYEDGDFDEDGDVDLSDLAGLLGYYGETCGEEPCPGDFNDDDKVNLSDLAILLANYGTPSGALYEDGDFDEDGDVDLSDLAGLLAYYGTICE